MQEEAIFYATTVCSGYSPSGWSCTGIMLFSRGASEIIEMLSKLEIALDVWQQYFTLEKGFVGGKPDAFMKLAFGNVASLRMNSFLCSNFGRNRIGKQSRCTTIESGKSSVNSEAFDHCIKTFGKNNNARWTQQIDGIVAPCLVFLFTFCVFSGCSLPVF